jgi:thiamine biosynthesis lipoprotein
LGTIVEITLIGANAEHCSEAFADAFAAISLVQRQMSFHDPASTLSRINAEALVRPVAVDRATFRVLRMARLFYSLSHGVFDPTIAPHLERAGFLPRSNLRASPTKGSNRPARVPVRPAGGSKDSSASTLRRSVWPNSRSRTKKKPSFDDVELLPGKRVGFRQPGIRLDLGGIAKGFAVDQAVSALQKRGIKSGLVNAGGDLRAFGAHAFPVGIRDPHRPGNILMSLRIRDRALATSAHYFADRLNAGALVGPFVDPKLGRVQGKFASVSIEAKTALVADALTKIVMLDPGNSLPVLQRFNAESLVCMPDGQIFSTPNWNEALAA